MGGDAQSGEVPVFLEAAATCLRIPESLRKKSRIAEVPAPLSLGVLPILQTSRQSRGRAEYRAARGRCRRWTGPEQREAHRMSSGLPQRCETAAATQMEK